MYGLGNSYDFSASGSCTVEGKVKVAKTVSGGVPAADQVFTFQLRQGASTTSEGTVLEQKTTDASGSIAFTTSLVPGETYQICEWVFPGWNTNLVGDGALFVPNSIIPPALPNPNVNNLTVCADFSVSSGQTRTFAVDNTPPPGGRALTIGFWKNWASCAGSRGGGQEPMLDRMLEEYQTRYGGMVVSAETGTYALFGPTFWLALHDTNPDPEVASDCQKAVRLLNKSNIATNKKMASDPAFNLAFPSNIPGVPFHHWAAAIAGATSIAHKGEVAGAKVMAGSIVDLLTKPDLLAKAKQTFAQEVAGSTYRSLLPADQKPPLGLNADEMAKYREAMKAHYLKTDIRFR